MNDLLEKYLVLQFENQNSRKIVLNEIQKYHKIEFIKQFYPTNNINFLTNGLDNDYLNSPEKWSTLIRLNGSGPFIEIYQVEKF